MKTLEEILKRQQEAKKEMRDAIPALMQAIDEEDWETAIQYVNGIHVGIIVVSVADGFIED